jgi:hypothetical protein
MGSSRFVIEKKTKKLENEIKGAFEQQNIDINKGWLYDEPSKMLPEEKDMIIKARLKQQKNIDKYAGEILGLYKELLKKLKIIQKI